MSERIVVAATVGVVAAVTAFTRGLPYLLFAKRRPPEAVAYLGDVLPAAIMVILVVYCLRDTSFTTPPYGAAEILSVLPVVVLQRLRGSTLLSALAGTVCYMVLIRTVFPV
jgi:branched-subunit amino acid transport protein AzlD